MKFPSSRVRSLLKVVLPFLVLLFYFVGLTHTASARVLDNSKVITTSALVTANASVTANAPATTTPIEKNIKNAEGNILYTGTVYHIFFHSLIVYPKLAFGDPKFSAGYRDWMVTRDEFKKILVDLHKNNFMLIDITSLYGVDKDGRVFQKDIYLPQGKRPLIISLDDLSYYRTLEKHGFADKLVFDKNGNVATEIVTESGRKEITRDGDVVPILDDFVTAHPDFSFKGAKGVIAPTGNQGILGYRTNNIVSNNTSVNYIQEVESAKKIVAKLKETGWRFASHSYSHDKTYSNGVVTLAKVKQDALAWDREVKPLIGETDIFIGPYGQIFKDKDPRRVYLISRGFKMFCGVGMDLYFHFYSDSITMNRADIDGYRLTHTLDLLKGYFDVAGVIDPLR